MFVLLTVFLFLRDTMFVLFTVFLFLRDTMFVLFTVFLFIKGEAGLPPHSLGSL